MINKLIHVNWRRHTAPLAIICLTTLLCLIPFLNKPLHIDDPLFVWIGDYIKAHPFDPYRLHVNWNGTEMQMSQITKNPPLASYYLALTALVAGQSETAYHLGFLLLALSASVGTYFLARLLCREPLIAALVSLLTPVYLVSASTLMCDVMMLSFWIWATFAWIKGLDTSKKSLLFISAILITGAAFSKYYGIALIPLLAIYSFARKEKTVSWIVYLLMPITAVTWYNTATYTLYGKALTIDAGSFTSQYKVGSPVSWLRKGLIDLNFTGGCLGSIIFLMPFLWTKRTISTFALIALPLSSLLLLADPMGLLNSLKTSIGFPLLLQTFLMTIAGLGLLSLAVADYRRNKDAQSLLLLLWVVGTFAFAGFFNWTINGRSILPMVPAIGILTARRLRQRFDEKTHNRIKKYIFWSLLPAAALSIAVTFADYRLAGTTETAAAKLTQKYQSIPGTLWFQGHWGFQYYMEKYGAKALDGARSELQAGDIIIVPANNTVSFDLPMDKVTPIGITEIASCRWISTMSPYVHSGFYSSIWGALPFFIGPVPLEKYYEVTVVSPIGNGQSIVEYNERVRNERR